MTGAGVGARRAPTGVIAPAPLALPGVLGFVGGTCVVLGAAVPGSPFTVQSVDGWFFGTRTGVAAVAADTRLLGIMLTFFGVALLLGSWFEVVRTLRRRPATSMAPVVGILVAWELPLAFGPPLFSRDVYSYAAQGEMVSRGLSPYGRGPSALGPDRFLDLVDPLWRHVPAPYGPAWERLSGWIVQLSGHDPLTAVVGFRVVALVGVTLLALAVPVLARTLGRDPSAALALAVLNPLVLLELLGGAHNDALMLGLLVAGCAAARKGHVVAGLALCSLAAEVKIPALVGAVFIGWWWAGPAADGRRRLGRVALAVAGAVGGMAVLAVVSGLGWRWVSGLSNPGAVVSWLDPATAVGLLLDHGAGALGFAGHQAGFVHGARVAGLVLAAVLSVRLLVRSDGRGDLAALGGSLLAFVLLGPVVWPWYATWGLVFLAVVAEGWVLALVVGLSVVGCFADVPKPRELVTGNPVLVTVGWALLAGATGLYLWTRVVGRAAAGRP